MRARPLANSAYWARLPWSLGRLTSAPGLNSTAKPSRSPTTHDPAPADHPVGRALHSQPMIAADGRCTGTLTLHLHWAKLGRWLTEGQQAPMRTLVDEITAWRSWYRRTIVLDALEYLRQHHRQENLHRDAR